MCALRPAVLLGVYPIGVPLVMGVVIWKERKHLSVAAPDGREKRDKFSAVVGAYVPEHCYWETVEYTRKVRGMPY
jgi:hypothetical protein